MSNNLYDKADEMWGNLVAVVCEEFYDGALEFDDAVEDLLFLGFDNDEACGRLEATVAADLIKRETLELV